MLLELLVVRVSDFINLHISAVFRKTAIRTNKIETDLWSPSGGENEDGVASDGGRVIGEGAELGPVGIFGHQQFVVVVFVEQQTPLRAHRWTAELATSRDRRFTYSTN